MMARNLRFNRFLVTAFPTRRLTAKATSGPDQQGCSKKLTDSGPERPR
jgi:hypothetical protein